MQVVLSAAYHLCTTDWEISVCPLTPWCKSFY